MKRTVTLFLCLFPATIFAQYEDAAIIKKIFDGELSQGKSYTFLEHLTTNIGPRLSGSSGAALAVEWTRQQMLSFADSVWLQPLKVPHWVRGKPEVGKILNVKQTASSGKDFRGGITVSVCALGGSVGTGPSGITAAVIEVKNFEELAALGAEHIKGKIIFFNRPMDPTKINTFVAYSGAVEQRGLGPSEAAKYGALGVIVRSMGSTLEDYPHTGGLRYVANVPKIPAITISTKDAELLSQVLKEEKDLRFYFESHCQILEDAPSYNVIGELKGTEFPDEFIVVSGHLDSWDLGQGAHDDGAGCVQAMEVLRLLKAIGYQPRRTIRAVMYMNEENGLRGGIEYAAQAELKSEKHVAAMESDRGGFTPRGFSMTVSDAVREKIKTWKPLLEPYGLTDFDQEGGGADIGPLALQGVPLIGYLPDTQRYFLYHHTREDTFDKVSQRELELGAAAMTSLVYLIDRYGLQ